MTSRGGVRGERLARLDTAVATLGTAARGTASLRPRGPGLPVPEVLSGLLPDGLERGGVLALDDDRYLAASLVGAAIRAGGSAALVGVDDLGIQAVAAAGAPLSRLVVVRSDPAMWIRAVEVLVGAVEVVLVRPPAPVADSAARRLLALLRRTAATATSLLVAGVIQAPLRLRVAGATWLGLDVGHGQLHARRARVVAEGRSTGGRVREVEAYLPGPNGVPRPLDAAPVIDELAARRRLAAA